MNKEINPVITVRLGEDLHADLMKYIQDIGVTDGGEAPARISNLIREALRVYLQDNELKAKGDLIKTRVERYKYIIDDLQEVSQTFPDTHGINRSMDYIYLTLKKFLFSMIKSS